MYTKVGLLVLLCTVSAVVSGNIGNTIVQYGLLIELGVVGGKVFYEVTEVPKVNWMAANDICGAHNRTIGITENNVEFKFVYDERRGKDFWIGASQKGFVKDGQIANEQIKSFEFTNGNPISNEINFFQNLSETLCVFVSGDDHTYVDNCLDGLHHVLCEKSI